MCTKKQLFIHNSYHRRRLSSNIDAHQTGTHPLRAYKINCLMRVLDMKSLNEEMHTDEIVAMKKLNSKGKRDGLSEKD